MTGVASTLKDLVSFLTEERKNSDDAIKNIILANHPAFRAFAKVTNTKYRIFFTTKGELDTWLMSQNYTPINSENLDNDSIAEWDLNDSFISIYIKLTHEIFDKKGKLIPITDNEWNDKWIQIKDSTQPPPDALMPPPDDDDIPF
jgi:hypothetical protein